MAITPKPGVAQGIRAANSGFAIGGAQIIANGADLNTAPIPNRIGDLLINYATGKLYIAGAVAATSDWNLVTSA